MDNSNISSFQKIEPLAPKPPPGGNLENRLPPAGPNKPQILAEEIMTENLRVVQNIQKTHPDFANLNEYEQTNLSFSLAKAGLPETGAILNTIA